MSPQARGRSARYALLLGFCALLTLALWHWQADPYLNPADDSGRYTVLAESLARTGDLRLINGAAHPRDTLYPPGYPALLALCIKLVGPDVGRIVMAAKATEAAILCGGILPLLALLLRKARLPFRWVAAGTLAAAICPALVGYANQVMTEIPFLFLCLAAIVPVEWDARLGPAARRPPAPALRLLSIACGCAAFLVRTAGATLLVVQVYWFWRRFGLRWCLLALLCASFVAGFWLSRNARIIASTPPGLRAPTYLEQVTLRDPDSAHPTRIPLTISGIAGRLREGVAAYIPLIPHSLTHMMSPPRTVWWVVDRAIEPLLLLLILFGGLVTLARGLGLSCLFSAALWATCTLWPWQSARFLVPLAPFWILFACAAGRRLELLAAHATAVQRWRRGISATGWAFGVITAAYFLHIDAVVARQQAAPPAYAGAYGRTPEEAGFYAACAWLRSHGDRTAVAMGIPSYLLYLYTGLPTTAVEPLDDPNGQEHAYMRPMHIRYLVQDSWKWSHTGDYLKPYLSVYRDDWSAAWCDPHGSGVTVWERLPDRPAAAPQPASNASPSGHGERARRRRRIHARARRETAHRRAPGVALYMDHRVAGSTTTALRKRDIDVLTAFEDRAHAMPDEDLVDRAVSPRIAPFSRGKDFLTIAARPQRTGQ